MSEASTIPLSYVTPSFPSLYWPFHAKPGTPKYLYTLSDIWRFTLYWTLIAVTAAHFLVAAWAVLMQFVSAWHRSRKHVVTVALPSSSSSLSSSSQQRQQQAQQQTAQNQISPEKSSSIFSPIHSSRIHSHLNDHNNNDQKPQSKPTHHNTTTTQKTQTKTLQLTAKNRKLLGENPISDTLQWVWIIPAVYFIIGILEAMLAGSLVGLVLGAVYNTGYFRMSTWTPLFWAIINMLILILASFRIQGGL